MIAIVDYGLGNISAFANVFHRLDIAYCVASTPDELKTANKIILPGVGAFDHAMSLLTKSGLREPLDEMVQEQGTPVIGICVGMQMMARGSDEGELDGLGWIPAHVRKFAHEDTQTYPLPHMGWNTLKICQQHPLLNGIEANPEYYFLHSYFFDCDDVGQKLATCDYAGEFACIVQHRNVYGIQCHPEKSHHNGVALLKNFAQLSD